MNKSIAAIEQYLISEGIEYFIDREEESPELRVKRRGAAGNVYRIRFSAKGGRKDLSVRVFCLVSGLSEEERRLVLPLINEYNMKYRFFSVSCDKDGDVNIRYDFLSDSKAPETCVQEIIDRIEMMVDDIYPELRSVLGYEN